jgi:DNA-binding protein
MADDDKREVTSIRINQDLWKKAKHEAINRDVSLADLVEQALTKELGIKESKVKEDRVR